MQLIFLFDPSQDRDRVSNAWLIDLHRLKPPRKRCVLLDVFAILIQSCGPNAVQFTARQSRFDQVCRVHCAITFASTHQSVHLVDEQQDFTCSNGHLIEYSLEPLFKFTPIFSTSNQRPHIKRQQSFVAQAFRHVTIDNSERHAFCNRRFTHAGFPYQNRVVLGAPRQHLHGAPYLFVTTNDGVNLALSCPLCEILRVFLQRLIAVFGTCAVSGLPLANIVYRLIELLCRHRPCIQSILCLGLHHAKRH